MIEVFGVGGEVVIAEVNERIVKDYNSNMFCQHFFMIVAGSLNQ